MIQGMDLSFTVLEKEKSRSRWNANGPSGANGNRNHDLFDANEALYQLSYSPLECCHAVRDNLHHFNTDARIVQFVSEFIHAAATKWTWLPRECVTAVPAVAG